MVVSNDWVVRGQTWREGANQVANDGARRESSGQAQ
jgi:hypothetical protein